MSRSGIHSISSRQVWDSRGNPTVEVEVRLQNGAFGRAIAPAGASRGSREAIDLRDGGSDYRGLGVMQALQGIEQIIAPALTGMDASDQAAIDAQILALDPSPLKTRLGGNATVACSLAVLQAAAAFANVPLWRHLADTYGYQPSMPLPEIQIFGGGAHAGRRVDVQDFMIMVPAAKSFAEALQITQKVYFAAGDIMRQRGQLSGVADEGGWWPDFDSNEEALQVLTNAIESAGEIPGERVVISLDVAASEFFNKQRYHLALEQKELDTDGMLSMYERWLNEYPIVSMEDPFAESDDEAMQLFCEQFGHRVQVVGDDYLVTNVSLVEQAIEHKRCNAALIKLNQAGTVSEAIAAFSAANSANWQCIVSARSGESEDVCISHLACGLNAGQLKVGSFSRTERMAKWNECLRIEEQLGADTFVAGKPLMNTWWQGQGNF
ncbi:MAG: phosphopyruvate hydratase [Granulosicoccus sp.]